MNGPRLLLIEELTCNRMTLFWYEVGTNVGRSVNNTDVSQIILKSVLLTSVQLHDVELGHRLVRITDWLDWKRQI